jgi:hypothetical protein
MCDRFESVDLSARGRARWTGHPEPDLSQDVREEHIGVPTWSFEVGEMPTVVELHDVSMRDARLQ